MFSDNPPVIASAPLVIASEAKQSRVMTLPGWIASGYALAMTAIFTTLSLRVTHLSLRASGTLPSEVIQGISLPRLDCFGLGPRNDGHLRYPRHCEQSAGYLCALLPFHWTDSLTRRILTLMETRLPYTYWKDGDFFVGYLNGYPDDSTQGLTLGELEEALQEVYEVRQEEERSLSSITTSL